MSKTRMASAQYLNTVGKRNVNLVKRAMPKMPQNSPQKLKTKQKHDAMNLGQVPVFRPDAAPSDRGRDACVPGRGSSPGGPDSADSA